MNIALKTEKLYNKKLCVRANVRAQKSMFKKNPNGVEEWSPMSPQMELFADFRVLLLHTVQGRVFNATEKPLLCYNISGASSQHILPKKI